MFKIKHLILISVIASVLLTILAATTYYMLFAGDSAIKVDSGSLQPSLAQLKEKPVLQSDNQSSTGISSITSDSSDDEVEDDEDEENNEDSEDSEDSEESENENNDVDSNSQPSDNQSSDEQNDNSSEETIAIEIEEAEIIEEAEDIENQPEIETLEISQGIEVEQPDIETVDTSDLTDAHSHQPQADIEKQPVASVQLSEIDIISNQLGLTPAGKSLLEGTQPQILRLQQYNENSGCRGALGCYYILSNLMFVLDFVEDEAEWTNIELTTISHELAHAQWFNLYKEDKVAFDKLYGVTKQYYEANSARWAKTLQPYVNRRVSEETLIAEVYAFAATEEATVPADMETSYSLIFSNRSTIINLHKTSLLGVTEILDAEIVALEGEIRALYTEINTLAGEINQLMAEINALREQMTDLREQIQALRVADNPEENQAEIDALIEQYNAIVPTENAKVVTINAKIVEYNNKLSSLEAKVDERSQKVQLYIQKARAYRRAVGLSAI